MSQANPCRRALTPVKEAKLFARDALKAARASWSKPADADHAMLAVFAVLAVDAVWPELLNDGAGDRRPGT